jgi:hypothetical protein
MRRPNLAAALVLAGCAPLVFAQTNSLANEQQPPVNVKHQAPQTKKNPPVPQVLQNYDFGAQLQALQDVDALTPGGTAAAGSNRGGDARKAPKDFRPMTDVPLNPTRCRSGTDERNVERRP